MKKTFRKTITQNSIPILMIITILLSVAAVLMPKAHGSPGLIRLYPDSPIVLGDVTGTDVIGQEFSVAVVVEDIVSAYGADLEIHWNTTYFDYVSHNFTMPWNGTTLSDTGPSPHLGLLYGPGVPLESLDTAAGTYYGAFGCMGVHSFDGSGTAYSIKFRVKKQPASYDIGLGNYLNITMNIFYAKIVDKSAVEITPPIEDGFVYLYSRIWQYPPLPLLKVMPENIDGLGIGNTHTVEVRLMGEGETDLDPFWDPGGFEIQLNFNTTLLEALDVTIDPDGWFAGPASNFWPTLLEIEKTIDNVAGTIVVVFAGYAGPGEVHNATEGKGILFAATFNETYESTKLPRPYAPITLQVPAVYDEWFQVHADAGLIALDDPVSTDWHAVDLLHFWTPYHIDDWIDKDGDGKLSVGDELNMTDGNTGKWRDYTLDVLAGTLDITQEELNVTDTMYACPTPANLSLSMPNLGINDVYMYMGNGTERYLDPTEYTENSTHVGIKANLDSYVCDTFIVAVNVTLDSWNGFSNYVGMGGVDYIEASNSTHTWNLNGTAGHDYSWWNCDDWWYLEAISGLARGDMLKAYYYAASILEVNYKTVEPDPDRYIEFEGSYDDWLASLTDPVCSNYTEISPIPWRSPYHVIGWLDEDSSGNLTDNDKLIMEYTRTGGIGRYVVNGLATDMFIARQVCICARDLACEFYGDKIKAWIAGEGHPDRDMCPWHNETHSVFLPHNVEDGLFTAAVEDVEPSIGTPSHSPKEPLPEDTVTVSVNVTDALSGVKEVILSYSNDTGTTWFNVSMSLVSGDTWEADIPAFPLGTEVWYGIIAYDNVGNEAVEDKAGEYYLYTVIPEFPTLPMLLASLLLITAMMIVLKKKSLRRKRA